MTAAPTPDVLISRNNPPGESSWLRHLHESPKLKAARIRATEALRRELSRLRK